MASYTRTGSPARSPALPPARTSTMNMHYLQTCVILENQKKSSVIIWTAPNEHNPPLQFRTFTGPPSQRKLISFSIILLYKLNIIIYRWN